MPAPLIDPRDRDRLAAQTSALAQRFSSWRPQPGGDAGQALICVSRAQGDGPLTLDL